MIFATSAVFSCQRLPISCQCRMASLSFRLNVLEKLLQLTKDPEAAMCADLKRGVRIGVDHDLVPSAHW